MELEEKKKVIQLPNFLVMLKYVEAGPTTLTGIHLETKMAYSFLHKAKKLFIELGVVKHVDESKMIVLTEKGQELSQIIDFMIERLDIEPGEINEYRIYRNPKGVKQNVSNEGN
jgi:predicted transcriptional regulator